MYILDTDILSLIHAGDARIAQHQARVKSSDIATTIISRIEILRARYEFLLKADSGEQLLRAQLWLRRSEELLNQVKTVFFDNVAALEFDRLRKLKKIKKIGRADLLIASIAIANRATLVTRNLKHFRQVPDLNFENWEN